MKSPTEKEIIKEVEDLRKQMKSLDFQMGIGGITEKKLFNKINKIIRMLKQPCRRVEFKDWVNDNKHSQNKRSKNK